MLCLYVSYYLDSQWDENIRHLTQRFYIRFYSCDSRCGVQERNTFLQQKCFCDKLCKDFGDYCFDFDSLWVSISSMCRVFIPNSVYGKTLIDIKDTKFFGQSLAAECFQKYFLRRSILKK